MHSGQGKAGCGVIEGAIAPARGVVALIAGLREVSADVAGVGRGGEVRHVAGHARSIAAVEGVVAVHVTLRALHGGVEPSQRKASAGVIKGGSSPGCGGVALLAGLREVGLHVAGVVGALEVRHVAGHASGIGAGERVVAVHVTLRALQVGMRPGQGEAGGGVIEACSSPGGCVVALLASLRKVGLHVARIIRVLEVREVAAYATGIRDVVVVVDVALRALHAGMGTRQREAGSRVIELGRRPGGGVVALIASLRKALLRVVRVSRSLKIFQVTAYTTGVGQLVIVIDVTLGTLHGCVRARERKTHGVVIECRG